MTKGLEILPRNVPIKKVDEEEEEKGQKMLFNLEIYWCLFCIYIRKAHIHAYLNINKKKKK